MATDLTIARIVQAGAIPIDTLLKHRTRWPMSPGVAALHRCAITTLPAKSRSSPPSLPISQGSPGTSPISDSFFR